MRENHLQTPTREQRHLANSRSKSISELNPKKISKKCLNSVFTSVSEVSLKSPKESMEFSSVSEFSDENQLGGDYSACFMAPVNPAPSSSSATATLSDLAPVSSIVTADKNESGNFSFKHSRSVEPNSSKIGSIETEMVVNHLGQALIQVLNSSTVDLQSKKLLDALIKVLIEHLFGLPEEEDRFAKLVSTKVHIVCLSFSLWILAILIFFFFCSGAKSIFNEPPPT